VDGALESGGEVGTWYDPMLAKIAVSGPTREAARAALVAAFDDTAILGLTTNTGFLRRLAASEQFRDAAIDTAWLDRNPGSFPPPTAEQALLSAAWTLAGGTTRQNDKDPFGTSDGWRLSAPAAPVLIELRHGAEDFLLAVDLAGGTVTEGQRAWPVRPADGSSGPGSAGEGTAARRLLLEVDGMVTSAVVQAGRHEVRVVTEGQEFRFTLPDAFGTGSGPVLASDGSVTAPMPGTVLTVRAEKGQALAAGQVLGVLEAMKMELPLAAPFDGVVSEVTVVVGDKVALGQRMFTMVPAAQVPPEAGQSFPEQE
jgi:3-methylcrotonyl-CoA carboxylase alpha subunit/acetyl-CoA/propionyl-CoA carboxylase biotin carboxyl carrier protein